MIRIVIDKDQKEKIEKIYRRWFNKHLDSFKEVVDKDEKLKYNFWGK